MSTSLLTPGRFQEGRESEHRPPATGGMLPPIPGSRRAHRVLPGFGISLGYTLLYLSLIVLIPLSALFVKASGSGWETFWTTVSAPRVVASYRLSIGASFIAASINGVA